jgi:leucine dehydrogenase
MDFKLAFAGIPRGGAKTVIIGDPAKDKTEQLLITFGEFLEFIGGEIHAGEDMGIGADDLKIISSATRYCTPGKSTAPATARGVYGGIRACFKKVFGDESFRNRKIAIQGIGKVGYELANLIHKSGGDLILADIDESVSKKAAKDFDARIVKSEAIYSVPCDVFSPCAVGNVITDDTIRHLNCKIIAGGANNQLQRWQLAYKLSKMGILYAPDYIINSGGVMANWFKKNENWVERKIYKEIIKLIKKAESRSMPPLTLARDLTVEKTAIILKSFKGYLKYEN